MHYILSLAKKNLAKMYHKPFIANGTAPLVNELKSYTGRTVT